MNRGRWIFTAAMGVLSGILLCVLGYKNRRWGEEYHKRCLYLAVLDDLVCRRRLKGMEIGGRKVLFPQKKESLWFRYQLFLESSRFLTNEEFEREIRVRQQELCEFSQKKEGKTQQ